MSDDKAALQQEDPTENFEVVTNEGAAPVADTVPAKQEEQQEQEAQESEAADGADSETPNAEKEQSGSGRLQKRIDRLTKRAADAERAADDERKKREAAEQKLLSGKQEEVADEAPDAADFDSYSDYLDALAKHNDAAGKKVEPKEADKVDKTKLDDKSEQDKPAVDADFNEALEDVQASFAESKAKYADFDEVISAPDLAITPDMVKALAETDDPAALAYFLGKNKTEATRIAGLKPLAIAREFGRIEAKLATTVKKRVTNAPEPITPVSGSDGTETKPEDMDFAEYEQYMNKREQKSGFW